MKNVTILRCYPVLGKKGILKELTLSEEQYKMIDQRRKAYLKGESESFTWNKSNKNARNTN